MKSLVNKIAAGVKQTWNKNKEWITKNKPDKTKNIESSEIEINYRRDSFVFENDPDAIHEYEQIVDAIIHKIVESSDFTEKNIAEGTVLVNGESNIFTTDDEYRDLIDKFEFPSEADIIKNLIKDSKLRVNIKDDSLNRIVYNWKCTIRGEQTCYVTHEQISNMYKFINEYYVNVDIIKKRINMIKTALEKEEKRLVDIEKNTSNIKSDPGTAFYGANRSGEDDIDTSRERIFNLYKTYCMKLVNMHIRNIQIYSKFAGKLGDVYLKAINDANLEYIRTIESYNNATKK